MSDDFVDYTGFVQLIIDTLEAIGVEYLIGGALAAGIWGEPRSTQDIDVVMDLPVETVVPLSRELEKRNMLVPPEIILDHLIEDRADIPINAIHPFSGLKADIYLLRPGDDLRRSALQRRKKVFLSTQLGEVYVHSPEDLIVYKLWYLSKGGQQKHIRDIGAMLKTLGDDLDFDYIQNWVNRLGLTQLWEDLSKKARSG